MLSEVLTMLLKHLLIISILNQCFKFVALLERKSKFWSVGVVKFANSECLSLDGAIGTCYTRRQCRELGGIPSGRCASNIGVCCVVQETCGGISSNNNTYFVNPGFPNGISSTKSCSYTIKKCNSEICQVRIDLLQFNLAQPDANGTCCIDTFNIVGGSSNIPTLCGENSGQHLYASFNKNENIRINIQIGSLVQTRSWRLKIAQIDCECPTRAPSGCLQYYTQITNLMQSFNYGATASSNLNVNGLVGTRQLSNTNYGICVEVSPGYCSITWSQNPNDLYSFSISNDTNNALMNNILSTPLAFSNGTNCTSDFIVIPNGVINNEASNVDRYCGNALPTITSFMQPFVLSVVSNSNDLNDNANRGFSLIYTQQPCTNKCATC